MSKRGKLYLRQNRRNRICPICGKSFDAKNEHIALCTRCKQMLGSSGKHRRQRFDR